MNHTLNCIHEVYECELVGVLVFRELIDKISRAGLNQSEHFL
jgi:hypothetical protein